MHVGACPPKGHFLRTAGCVVRHLQRALQDTFRRWMKRGTDRAMFPMFEVAWTIVGLAELASHGNLSDEKNPSSSVGQLYGPCLASRENQLGRECQACVEQRHRG